MASSLRLQVNGRQRKLAAPGADASVLDLLASLDQHPKTVAVEVNRELVPRVRFGDTRLRDGDRVEIVRFVQGGSGGSRSGIVARRCRTPDVARHAARRLGR